VSPRIAHCCATRSTFDTILAFELFAFFVHIALVGVMYYGTFLRTVPAHIRRHQLMMTAAGFMALVIVLCNAISLVVFFISPARAPERYAWVHVWDW
jgi:hypothetical protein